MSLRAPEERSSEACGHSPHLGTLLISECQQEHKVSMQCQRMQAGGVQWVL